MYVIGTWILNAVAYAVIICSLAFVAFGPVLAYWDLYGGGTAVYTALCMSLQWKVGFLHHQWNYLNVIMMAISVGGMLLYFYVLNELSAQYVSDYYYEANFVYSEGVYWFFCFFSIPLFTSLLDVVIHSFKLFFKPDTEMLYREVELEVSVCYVLFIV